MGLKNAKGLKNNDRVKFGTAIDSRIDIDPVHLGSDVSGRIRLRGDAKEAHISLVFEDGVSVDI